MRSWPTNVDNSSLPTVADYRVYHPKEQPVTATDSPTPTDLALVERNLHNGNYLTEQLKPAMLKMIDRIRELESTMTEIGSDLVDNFVGEDREERYGIQQHGLRLQSMASKGVVL